MKSFKTSGLNTSPSIIKQVLGALALISLYRCSPNKTVVHSEAKTHRVIVSTDIGGTDFDDYQSLVHLLLYADTLDIEGMIASPYGEGRKEHIGEAIDAYEMDYPKLTHHSSKYPTAEALRQLVKQGAKEIPGPLGYDEATEGSNWIIDCARRKDPRPLHILIWGGLEDLAQALHDAPDILPKLRVYFIGGPNKKWSVNAYQYLVAHHPTLWMIEANASYRGWFLGGEQSGSWSNTTFVEQQIKDCGALGTYFYSKGDRMKMGDSPSLTWLLYGNSDNPELPSWGGQFVPAWERPHKVFQRITTVRDSLEQFGVLELRLPIPSHTVEDPYARMQIDRPIRAEIKNDTARFLFSPKNPSVYPYTIESNIPGLNAMKGSLTSYQPPAENKSRPSPLYPNWWTDDPSIHLVEDGYIGVKTVNRWRRDFLTDFARRMRRCCD